MTLYAKMVIESMQDEIDYFKNPDEVYKVRYTQKAVATITVEFSGEIPDKILEIMRTGELK